jgi:hypothetical protein
MGPKQSFKFLKKICGGIKVTSMSRKRVCHIVALPLTLKGILMQKKNYGNSNISPCKK